MLKEAPNKIEETNLRKAAFKRKALRAKKAKKAKKAKSKVKGNVREQPAVL